MKQKRSNNYKGAAALITVIILGSIGLLITISLLTYATIDAQYVRYYRDSVQAYYLANTCAESALSTLRENNSYAGNETLTIGDDECTILPIVSAPPDTTITVEATIGESTKRLEVVVSQFSPTVVVSSWEEI